MITYKIKIGNGMLEWSGDDPKSAHKFGAIYGALPKKCDECGSTDLYLSHKAPKENDYFTINCKDCGAELSFHQKKTGGFYIVAGEKMKKYIPDDDNRKSDKTEKPVSDDVF